MNENSRCVKCNEEISNCLHCHYEISNNGNYLAVCDDCDRFYYLIPIINAYIAAQTIL